MSEWKVWTDPEGKDRCAYIDCDGKSVAHVFADSESDRDRNASLIAAAPAMLDLLREMLFDEHGKEWIDSETGDDEWDGRTWKAKQDAKALIARLVPNAELCGGPSGPSERAPGYASAPKTEE